ncbi:MSHA biogenesis protein MshG [Halorhodospira abdelmalekii]|uniref:type II secretion system F family protein n=1 Tax=Halorhodospira abdelmalekii TaxID=421629 RepID=UPI0019068BFE|nr:type II secretion system F family protein [Halorhodospira abdelmalekii]MBK1735699.1 MSHA biogenesis protein MshG [Halorhodospira abdelmalekii]
MPRFEYRGRDRSGAETSGVLDAASEAAAIDELFGRGVTPTTLRPAAAGGGGGARGGGAQGMEALRRRFLERAVKIDDLLLFIRQLYALIKAGVPIIRALNGLAENTRNVKLQRAIYEVVERLEGGYSLGDAMAASPDVFPGLLVAMVRVGEDSGRLEESLLRMAANLEQEHKTRMQVKQALRYPKIVLAVIVLAIVVINIYVIPAFTSVFERFDADLPLITRGLIATSNFTAEYWFVMLLSIGAVGVAVRTYIATPDGRIRWDRGKLRIPVIGGILLRALLARFARTLSMALRSGVPVLQALSSVAATTDNAHVSRGIEQMREGIGSGEGLHQVARETGLFTALVLQMLAVGEETGQISDMMDEVAEFYEREVAADLDSISSYIEPVVVGFIGVLVLLLALGIFMPMWQMGQAAL